MTASTRSEDCNRTALSRHCWSRKSSNEPNNCLQRRRSGVKGNDALPVGHTASHYWQEGYMAQEKGNGFGTMEPHQKSVRRMSEARFRIGRQR